MADAEVPVARLIDDVLASGRELREYVSTLDHDATLRSNPTWSARSRRVAAAQSRLAHWVQEKGDALAVGDVSAAAPVLTYLEADPYYFRSGYARNRLVGRLAHVALADPELSRARTLVLASVDGRCHCGQPGLGRLAGSVADNRLRHELRGRLHSPDGAIAHRALRTLVRVRRPGITAHDIAAARLLVLNDAGNGQFATPSVERLALWLWDPQWRSELEATSRHHGPHRAGAKRLLAAVDRRRRRPGP